MIIGLSGKMKSGKNTVATIIQGLNMSLDLDMIIYQIETGKPFDSYSDFKQVAFGDKLREIASLITGIKVEDLQKQSVKESYLDDIWNYSVTTDNTILVNGKAEHETRVVKMTVRELLQKIGTDCLRNNLHPDVWVNALMADYYYGKWYYRRW
jgi:cytidylate kinase